MENWKKFTNEAKKKTGIIKTVDGDKEVVISYEVGNFFVYKSMRGSKAHYLVTHMPSGNLVPSKFYYKKYGFKFKEIKKMLKDIDENLNLPDLAEAEPSAESLQALVDLIGGQSPLNEYISKQTSQNFQKFADAIGAVSSSMSDDAEQSEKFQKLMKDFEEAGLEDFLEKIPDVETLLQSLDDPESAGEFVKALQDLDLSPQEIGEKLEQIQILRDEFDEYKEEQEEASKERDESQAEIDQKQDKAAKEASRERTDAKNTAEADQTEI